MFALGRLVILGITLYATYRLGTIIYEHRNLNRPHHTSAGPSTRKRCVICNETVLPSHEDKSQCGCVRHRDCMIMLIHEGQNVCPGCWSPRQRL